MSETCWSWTSKKELPSRSGAHLPYLEEILRELERLGWSGRDYFGVQMALEESLSNAIRHGNRLDESKRVLVECKLSAEQFWLRVADEGPGFKPHSVPDCTADENLECTGGRGLALIQAYMTRVEYNNCGNCVTMEKTRTIPGNVPESCRSCGTSDSQQE
ncbi:MAG TPA: ATP-binding protein [Lacipirellulaceae bacterium]|nr:ATP-binding protein [Lacipirellulaceae bacterium]